MQPATSYLPRKVCQLVRVRRHRFYAGIIRVTVLSFNVGLAMKSSEQFVPSTGGLLIYSERIFLSVRTNDPRIFTKLHERYWSAPREAFTPVNVRVVSCGFVDRFNFGGQDQVSTSFPIRTHPVSEDCCSPLILRCTIRSVRHQSDFTIPSKPK